MHMPLKNQHRESDEQLNSFAICDADTDSMSIIPLAILPLDSVALRGLSMVKNNNIESVVQMFSDEQGGAGHVLPRNLNNTIREISFRDMKIINSVGGLHSFDVFCLRISLRSLGIKVNDTKFLKLSPAMEAELEEEVRPLTERLVREIFGEQGANNQSLDISEIFENSNMDTTRQNLALIADKMQINIAEIPQFLEDFGDIYLSIAFYRNRLKKLNPLIDNFCAAMDMITSSEQLKANHDVILTAKKMFKRATTMRDVLCERFQSFSTSTDIMWDDMNASNFSAFKDMVEDNHTAIGGILCKLGIKMDAWHRKFPSIHIAGPNRVAEYLMTDMRKGF